MNELFTRNVYNSDAVMFDIDDTLIFTDNTPNIEIINLLLRLLYRGYKIIIITARPGYKSNINWTKDQLKYHNIPYHELYFCPPEQKTIVKMQSPYNYLLSVGDQDTDLTDSKYYLKIVLK